ncbi:AraC family transcriptional regulator [Dongia sp.]|uniref:AraC family transcriptional regulator n=1 Tax=Dongia sp. TaxID=1977262 RepID=UPI0035B3EC02
MRQKIGDGPATGLERSGGKASPSDWLRFAPAAPGIDRLDAFFTGHAYDDHRHDTYAIGLTLSGVQSFDCRGARRDSVAGQVVVVYPDESHNGRSGVAEGFRYRMIYVAPHRISAALEGQSRHLPFLRDIVSQDPRLMAALTFALRDMDRALDDLEQVEIVAALAEAMAANDPSTRPGRTGRPPKLARVEAERARLFLDAATEMVNAEALEDVSGLDRFTLNRHFRRLYGTSPYNYLIMRRLDRARGLLAAGTDLADIAVATGFADQSHFTRQFKRAYGRTPAAWKQMLRA